MPSGLEQEFFGAALWQLYKGVDSPYKAALKLLLMETYASEHPYADLLCMRFKEAIYNGEKDIDALDPYIMLYRKIESHLRILNDEKRLALIQRCFYFKVGQELGDLDTSVNESWQRKAMKKMTQEWGWDMGYASLLDHRDNWKIDRVLEERKILVDALTQSYQLLSDFARKATKLSDINQKDLQVLGRKLYAAFERKVGKIEIINRGISQNIWESHITLHESGSGEHTSWCLYQGAVFSDDIVNTTPLKRSRSIINLITWCFLNKLIDQRTVIAVYANESSISLSDIRAIMRGLDQMFPSSKLIHTRMDDLIKSPRVINGNVFINVGKDPSKQRLSQGMTLTSDKTDALSFSGIEENLVQSMDLTIQNSWQEVLAYHFEDEQGILDCLGVYLQISPPSQGTPPPPVTCHCFTIGRGMAIANRVQEMFSDVIDCFYYRSQQGPTRYILSIGRSFHVISYENDVYDHKAIGNYSSLLRYLNTANSHFVPVVIDRYAVPKSPLPVIYRNNKPVYIQVYYGIDGNNINVYVLDENGSLFHQIIKNTNEQIFLNQYTRFLKSVTYKQSIHNDVVTDGSGEKINTIECYRLAKNKSGQIRIVPKEYQLQVQKNYYKLHVIADIAESGQASYTLYCNDTEYTSLEYGDGVFQKVARDVISHRNSGSTYPIHITDIEFSRPHIGKESTSYLQTVYCLNYKRGIEEKLNQALAEMTNGHDGNQAQA